MWMVRLINSPLSHKMFTKVSFCVFIFLSFLIKLFILNHG